MSDGVSAPSLLNSGTELRYIFLFHLNGQRYFHIRSNDSKWRHLRQLLYVKHWAGIDLVKAQPFQMRMSGKKKILKPYGS